MMRRGCYSVYLRKIFRKVCQRGCIPESFVRNYAVDFEPVGALTGVDTAEMEVSTRFRRGLAKVRR